MSKAEPRPVDTLNWAVRGIQWLGVLLVFLAVYRYIPGFWQEPLVRAIAGIAVFTGFRWVVLVLKHSREHRISPTLARWLRPKRLDQNLSPEFDRIRNTLEISKRSPDYFLRWLTERDAPRELQHEMIERSTKWKKQIPMEDLAYAQKRWEEWL